MEKLVSIKNAYGQLGVSETTINRMIVNREFTLVRMPCAKKKPIRRLKQSEIDSKIAEWSAMEITQPAVTRRTRSTAMAIVGLRAAV